MWTYLLKLIFTKNYTHLEINHLTDIWTCTIHFIHNLPTRSQEKTQRFYEVSILCQLYLTSFMYIYISVSLLNIWNHPRTLRGNHKTIWQVLYCTSFYSLTQNLKLAVGEMMPTSHQGCSSPMRLPVFRRPTSFDSLTLVKRLILWIAFISWCIKCSQPFCGHLNNWSGILMSRYCAYTHHHWHSYTWKY